MSQPDADQPVTPLYPPGPERPLRGLYLERELPERGRFGPFVYGNFIATLDGRIALTDPTTQRLGVTSAIGESRDWRLFQELAARADVILTSGRYLRDLKLGVAQDVLPLSSAAPYRDLRTWREARGLPTHPDVAVISASLDFSLPDALFRQGRRVHVFTTSQAPEAACRRLRAAGASVEAITAEQRLDGATIARSLDALGYRRAYSVTGPWVLHALLAGGALDGLFLTQRHRLVAGEGYSTIVEGPALPTPVDLTLEALYLDTAAEGSGQQYAAFRRTAP